MLSLDPQKLRETTIPISTSWLLGACMEAKGKQGLLLLQKPDKLEFLRQETVIRSVESSNRIEGVTVPASRLRPVVLGNEKPQDRSEEELAGYRKALGRIHERPAGFRITPESLLQIHALAQGGTSGDAGKWKERDNRIVEILPGGGGRIRFEPTPASETPRAVEQLCANHVALYESGEIPALLLAATFVLDLLCVHPFRDGNGRVSRLVTTLLLQSDGFEIGRYVSLEQLVEDRRDEYYDALRECSVGWHDGANPLVPWWNFLLGIVRNGYTELERLVESAGTAGTRADQVRGTILRQQKPFTLSDIRGLHPAVSAPLIKSVLSDLKAEGLVELRGRGRGAVWEVVHSESIR